MKHLFILMITLGVMTVFACKDDEPTSIYEYHAHIHQPDSTDRIVGDTLPIEVEFESHTGETIHHINVRIYNKSTLTEVYNKPTEAHVHDTSGAYTYEDQFVLSAANGVSAGTWVLVATVWGDQDGEEEESEEVEFQVKP